MRDFPSTADVGRLLPAEEAMGSERSEWERSERKDREEGEEGGGGRVTPSPMASADGEKGTATLSFVLSSVLLSSTHLLFSGEARPEANGELAMCRHHTDSGQEPDKMYDAIVQIECKCD